MDNSPLQRLPAELRIRIYEYALTEDTAIKIYWNARSKPSTFHFGEERLPFVPSRQHCFPPRQQLCLPARHPLALTATCKQIYNESLAIFLSSNKFSLSFPDFPPHCHAEDLIDALKNWLADFDPYQSMIRDLVVDLGDIPAFWLLPDNFVKPCKKFSNEMAFKVDIVVQYGTARENDFTIPISINTSCLFCVRDEADKARDKLKAYLGRTRDRKAVNRRRRASNDFALLLHTLEASGDLLAEGEADPQTGRVSQQHISSCSTRLHTGT